MAVIKEAGALVSDYYKALYRQLSQPESATWSIGYAVLDAKTWEIKVRSDSPFIRPSLEIGPGNQLIAFANSLVREGDRQIQTLYYTIANKRSACARIVTDL